jgi:hypothetical protein
MAKLTFAHERFPSILVASPQGDLPLERAASELVKIGYRLVDEDWLVGGSQEISIFWFARGRDKLILQAETYEGLKIFGAKKFLQEVQYLAVPIQPVAEQTKHL